MASIRSRVRVTGCKPPLSCSPRPGSVTSTVSAARRASMAARSRLSRRVRLGYSGRAIFRRKFHQAFHLSADQPLFSQVFHAYPVQRLKVLSVLYEFDRCFCERSQVFHQLFHNGGLKKFSADRARTPCVLRHAVHICLYAPLRRPASEVLKTQGVLSFTFRHIFYSRKLKRERPAAPPFHRTCYRSPQRASKPLLTIKQPELL